MSSPGHISPVSIAAFKSIDAGKLITAEEIQAIVGEPLKQPITSVRAESGFIVSQCYFLVTTPSNSVVLSVTQRGTGSEARDPRDFWNEKFHDQSKDKRPEQEEHKQNDPEPISGVGDEAYWVASGSNGALYILDGDRFLRVAIGGGDDKTPRIEKAKRLAQFASKRLPRG